VGKLSGVLNKKQKSSQEIKEPPEKKPNEIKKKGRATMKAAN